MRTIFLCATLVIACSGLVKAADNGGLFVPSGEESSTVSQKDRWKPQRKSSCRSTANKRTDTDADRDDAAGTEDIEKPVRTASADNSIPYWVITLTALGVLAVMSAAVFCLVRTRQTSVGKYRSRDRSSAATFLAASLVQTQLHNEEILQSEGEPKEARRAA